MLQSVPSPTLADNNGGSADDDLSSKTHAFFASNYDSPLPPPTLTKSKSAQSLETASDVTRSRSLNLDFFAVNPPTSALRVQPPSSVHACSISRNSSRNTSSGSSSPVSTIESSTSDLSHSPLTPSLHLLSRLFPSRHSTLDESSLLESSKRRFLDLDSTTSEPFIDVNIVKTEETPKPTPKPSSIVPSVFKSTPIVDSTPKPLQSWNIDNISTAQLSTSPEEDLSMTHSGHTPKPNTPSSMSIDMLPTPAGSRNGSMYGPTGSLLTSARPPSTHLFPEPQVESPFTPLQSGSVISSISEDGDCNSITLVHALGQGSFSSVWLGRDDSASLEKVIMSRKESIKKQQINGEGSVRRKISRRSRPGTERSNTLNNTDMQSEMTRNSSVNGKSGKNNAPVEGSRLVAVKLIERALCDINDRTRVSFIREVEVLKHISHPSIVSYIHSFTAPAYHCLVLEHIDGEELFQLINSDNRYEEMDEPRLRRIWGELCKAVGWLHEVLLVHRDIKLENILLTRDLRLPLSSSPLIKLTDFGLSRFIDPENPLLATRCGSESYAAPEIITGRKYDGRETDAWACGVVLYALATRKLPFESGHTSSSRKAMLMRIAKCEYEWPKDDSTGLGHNEGITKIVGRLLVRDPKKRSKMKDLWDDGWMLGEGAPVPPPPSASPSPPLGGDTEEEGIAEDLVEEDVIDDGLIVDGDRILSVASQELQ